MRPLGWIAFAAAISLVGGCSQAVTVKGENGETITADGKGNFSMDDGKGNTVDAKMDSKGTLDVTSSKGAEMHINEQGMTGKTDEGESYSMGASQVTEEELGLPFYPGSEPEPKSDIKVAGDKENTYVSVRTTADTPEQVVEFYKPKLSETSVTTTDELCSLSGKFGEKTVTIIAQLLDGKTRLNVSVQDKK